MGFFISSATSPYAEIILYIEIVVAILLAIHILLKKQDPQSCMGWLLAVAVSPLIAGVFYIAFGMNPFEIYSARRRRSKSVTSRLTSKLESQTAIREINTEKITEHGFENFERTMHWISQFNAKPSSTGNELSLLINSNVVYQKMREDIEQAKHFILVQFYQIQADEVGLGFLDLLVEKSRQGVAVYVIYDALGSISLKVAMVKRYRELGLNIVRFLEIHPIKRRFQVNWRNHRKLVVVDGRVAFVGGFNMGKLYLQGPDLDRPTWVDLLFRVRGPILSDLIQQFVEDWHFATGNLIESLSIPQGDQVEAIDSKSLLNLVQSGPSEPALPFYSTLLHVLFEAKKRVWIMTPYFVPDRTLLNALRLAVGRGVHVRVIIPKHSNHQFTDLCSSSYFAEIQSYGIEILRYKYGVCHGKIAMGDDDLILAGSSNMDYRSFFLNFETDMLIRDKKLADEVHKFFELMETMCERLRPSDVSKVPVGVLLVRRMMRLLAPLM